jgi:hypothetical protein
LKFQTVAFYGPQGEITYVYLTTVIIEHHQLESITGNVDHIVKRQIGYEDDRLSGIRVIVILNVFPVQLPKMNMFANGLWEASLKAVKPETVIPTKAFAFTFLERREAIKSRLLLRKVESSSGIL